MGERTRSLIRVCDRGAIATSSPNPGRFTYPLTRENVELRRIELLTSSMPSIDKLTASVQTRPTSGMSPARGCPRSPTDDGGCAIFVPSPPGQPKGAYQNSRNSIKTMAPLASSNAVTTYR